MNAKELLLDVVPEAIYLFKKDLAHISEDQSVEKPGPDNRTIQELVCECAGFMAGITTILKGAPTFELPGTEGQFDSKVKSKEDAIAFLDKSIEELMVALADVDESVLDSKIMAPWGQELTRAKLVYWAAANTMYHDGQVCYFQMMNGDKEMHWMEQ